MKRFLSIFMVLFLLFSCFTGCAIAEKDSENPSDQPSESQSETESISTPEESETESATESDEDLKKVFFKEDDIPGTQLDFSAIYSEKRFHISTLGRDKFMVFETKESCDQVLLSLNPDDQLLQAIEQVDFENYSLLAIETSVTSSETLVLDQVIQQDGRLVFVYHAEFLEVSTEDVIPQTTWIAIKKTDLPQGDLDCFICSYFTTAVSPDLFLPDYLQGSVYYLNYYEYQ